MRDEGTQSLSLFFEHVRFDQTKLRRVKYAKPGMHIPIPVR